MQSIRLPLCHLYLSCPVFLFKEPRTALQLQLSLYNSCFQWGNLGSILFAMNFIHTSLTFRRATSADPSFTAPFSVWKQKFRGSRTGLPVDDPAPFRVKGGTFMSSDEAAVRFCWSWQLVFLFRPFPSLPCTSGLPFSHFLHSSAYWCAWVLSLYQLHQKCTQLQMLVYVYIFTCLQCFGVDSSGVFSRGETELATRMLLQCVGRQTAVPRVSYESAGGWVSQGPKNACPQC